VGKSKRIEELEASLRKVVPALREAGVPFLLAGSAACYAYGGPPPERDIDIFVTPDDAEQALEALEAAGLRPERPPEEWLLKAWDGDVLVDLIFSPKGLELTPELISRGIRMGVAAMSVPVMTLEDLFASKLLALDEHNADYSVLLLFARAVREQVDWEEVRARTRHSPLAVAFFTMIEELRLVHHAAPRERHVHITAIGTSET
jgi:predicted nucleotidyltransferase